MGCVSLLVVRLTWLLYPLLACLTSAFVSLWQRSSHSPVVYKTGAIRALAMAAGLLLMHRGYQQMSDNSTWTWTFWCGESFVIFMFTLKSLSMTRNAFVVPGRAVFAMLAALWFRGDFWNYVTVLVLEATLMCLVVVAFSVVEVMSEEILNEKLKKVGDKVRARHAAMERYYPAKQQKKRCVCRG